MKKIIFIVCFCGYLYNINAQSVHLYTPNGNVYNAELSKEGDIGLLEIFMEQYFLPYKDNVIILSCASALYDCHPFAWIIAEGGPVVEYSPQDYNVLPFWQDGSYEKTDAEHAEKVYYAGAHSAVKSNGKYPGMYISKWAGGPLVVHAPDAGPWTVNESTTYYRLKCPSIVENQHYTANDVNISTRCDTLKIKNTTIEAGANVSVTSNKVIRLLPGFHAKAGSSFHAKIEKFTFDVDNPVLPIEIDWSPCEKYSITPPAAPKIKSVVNNNNNNTENDDAENATKASAPNTVILYVPSDPLVSTKYYNLQGIEIHKPLGNSIYIEKQTYQSGKIETRKVFRH